MYNYIFAFFLSIFIFFSCIQKKELQFIVKNKVTENESVIFTERELLKMDWKEHVFYLKNYKETLYVNDSCSFYLYLNGELLYTGDFVNAHLPTFDFSKPVIQYSEGKFITIDLNAIVIVYKGGENLLQDKKLHSFLKKNKFLVE